MADSNVQKKRWVQGWPGQQNPEAVLLVSITNLEKQGRGLFGLNQVEALGTNLRDAHILEGVVIDGDEDFNNTKIKLVFPRAREKSIETNDHVAMGILKSDPEVNSFICMEKVPSELSLAGKLKWLENWKCPNL